MNVIVNGKTFKAIKTDECDEKFTEYDVYIDEGLVGRITKYGDEIHYTAWVNSDEPIGTNKTVRGAIELLANIFT